MGGAGSLWRQPAFGAGEPSERSPARPPQPLRAAESATELGLLLIAHVVGVLANAPGILLERGSGSWLLPVGECWCAGGAQAQQAMLMQTKEHYYNLAYHRCYQTVEGRRGWSWHLQP